MKAIAIIPARGGSKRLPRKNLQPLGGVPLVVWSIRSAMASKLLSAVYVSTDDAEIADVADRHGAEPIMRPANMALDDSPIERCLRHVYQVLKERMVSKGAEPGTLYEWPEVTVTLQPTSPFRADGLIDRCIATLRDRPSLNSVMTVRRAGVTWWQELDYGPTGARWIHQFGDYPIPQSQDWQIHHERWSEDGSVFATRTRPMLYTENRRVGPVSTIVNEWSPDIDEESDLRLAESILRAREGVPA